MNGNDCLHGPHHEAQKSTYDDLALEAGEVDRVLQAGQARVRAPARRHPAARRPGRPGWPRHSSGQRAGEDRMRFGFMVSPFGWLRMSGQVARQARSGAARGGATARRRPAARAATASGRRGCRRARSSSRPRRRCSSPRRRRWPAASRTAWIGTCSGAAAGAGVDLDHAALGARRRARPADRQRAALTRHQVEGRGRAAVRRGGSERERARRDAHAR